VIIKKYFSIGEVAELFDIATSKIRFWESYFDLKIKRNRKGNRIYKNEDIIKISNILHKQKNEGRRLSWIKNMKQTIIILALLLMGVSAQAQTVDGVEVANFNAEYIELQVMTKLLSKKVTIAVDYGQPMKFISGKAVIVLDEDGKKVIWNGQVDALNWFFHYGYQLWSTRTIQIQGGIYTFHLLKQR